MQPVPDLYACLGVERTATTEKIRYAYRQAARRFHPDVNPDALAQEEFKLIAFAYEVLNDAQRRAEYDARTARSLPTFSGNVVSSRAKLLRLPEPQIVYILAEIRSRPEAAAILPPLNLCLVIDRSTSMQGARLDQVKSAAIRIVESLNEKDIFSVITFSDRAEVVLAAQPCTGKATIISKISGINAGGGTEILQGLLCGLLELQQNLSPGAVNQLILLTDGRTYGDEDACLLLAMLASGDGITITGLGIGDEWNDAFLDQLAAGTGGESHYISSPTIVTHILTEQVRGLSDTVAQHLRVQAICDPGVKLKSAFRVAPDAQPLASDSQPIRLGNLVRDHAVSVLFEFVVATNADPERAVARLWVIGDILSSGPPDERVLIDIQVPQTDTPDITPPPLAVVAALDRVTLYRLQEKAWSDVDEGNIAKATQRLQTLASRLLANGERELASLAMNEAARLNQTRQVSAENRKRIKYGTRALIPPPKPEP